VRFPTPVSVCLSVCLLSLVHRATTVARTEVPFRRNTHVAPSNCVLVPVTEQKAI